MKANGAHYKLSEGEEHHKRVLRLGLNWYAANITKYAERGPHKGTLIDDVIKVLDYGQMWLDAIGGLSEAQKAKLIEISLKIQKQTNTDGPQPKGYVDQDRSA